MQTYLSIRKQYFEHRNAYYSLRERADALPGGEWNRIESRLVSFIFRVSFHLCCVIYPECKRAPESWFGLFSLKTDIHLVTVMIYGVAMAIAQKA